MVLNNLGMPTNQSWPGLKELPDYNKISFRPSKGKPFEKLIPDTDSACIDLIKSFLCYDGRKRLEAKKVHINITYRCFSNTLKSTKKKKNYFLEIRI